MDDADLLASRFEDHRAHLQSVAYRLLGSLTDADDAVQEAWPRLARTEAAGIDNLGGWLTTVVSRVCLDMLRSRRQRREDPLDTHIPDPVVIGPENDAVIADSVGLALLVVLEALSPAERLAFVLHDMFGLPFEQIAAIMDRSPAAARKLASRARQRVQGATATPDPTAQRRVVDAFLAAARGGDLAALVAVLDPDVTLRTDSGNGTRVLRGTESVAGQLATFHRMASLATAHPALVYGMAGLVNTISGEVFSIMAFTVADERIVAIDILSDPDRLSLVDLSDLDLACGAGRTTVNKA
ncbi:sigma-70 family RNA polymerase sigma factor [Actinokineospora globicatena]|uniref:DNA-directed RNA polymerase sigma-70 factor n=1 Tax=Actinokineospora globicatena TaxID=103729 RepID=A0A9W6QI91_9PSEU|nr:sigma-70 family RNA polymerase sigma factor [Actinokineospora globicatena]GLW89952.1 DNA-directed RNA polymerase sigma-70 factor [Actinokineospora globicatena]